MKSFVLAIRFEVANVRGCIAAQCVWTRASLPNSRENRASLSAPSGVRTCLMLKLSWSHFCGSAETTINPNIQMQMGRNQLNEGAAISASSDDEHPANPHQRNLVASLRSHNSKTINTKVSA